jgi:protein TonB
VQTWQQLLLAHIERQKRYPSLARRRRQEGVTYLRFVMDREGQVLSARIERSSGYAILDEETMALIERAAPLPAPPPEVSGKQIELIVPVQFFIR